MILYVFLFILIAFLSIIEIKSFKKRKKDEDFNNRVKKRYSDKN